MFIIPYMEAFRGQLLAALAHLGVENVDLDA
jgi:hypothetical protein